MSDKQLADELAAKLQAANDQVLAVVRSCSPAQWATVVPAEERTIGTLIYHLATSTQMVMQWVMSVANGDELPTNITLELKHHFNAQQAAEHMHPDKAETLQLLETSCNDAAAQLRTLTDEQLTIATPFSQPYRVAQPSLIDGNRANARHLVEWNLIYHRQEHLSQIKAVL